MLTLSSTRQMCVFGIGGQPMSDSVTRSYQQVCPSTTMRWRTRSGRLQSVAKTGYSWVLNRPASVPR